MRVSLELDPAALAAVGNRVMAGQWKGTCEIFTPLLGSDINLKRKAILTRSSILARSLSTHIIEFSDRDDWMVLKVTFYGSPGFRIVWAT